LNLLDLDFKPLLSAGAYFSDCRRYLEAYKYFAAKLLDILGIVTGNNNWIKGGR
jgi:hypothetical protein